MARVAIVTGGTRGIGEAISLALRDAGLTVAANYAGNDERINAGIPAYKDALATTGVKHEIHMYEGAQHAFNNDTTEARYNKAAADLAWSRTIATLKRALA